MECKHGENNIRNLPFISALKIDTKENFQNKPLELWNILSKLLLHLIFTNLEYLKPDKTVKNNLNNLQYKVKQYYSSISLGNISRYICFQRSVCGKWLYKHSKE